MAGLGTRAGDKISWGKARVNPACRQERAVTTQTVLLDLIMDTAWGRIRVIVSFAVLSGERNLVILSQKMLREVLLTEAMADFMHTVVVLSSNGTLYSYQRESSGGEVDVTSPGISQGNEQPISVGASGAGYGLAGQLTVKAHGSFLVQRGRSAIEARL